MKKSMHELKNTKERRLLTMRSRIFIALIFFIAVVLAIMWIFQTFMLSGLYKNVRINEMEKCASALGKSDIANYNETARKLSEKYYICISVYEINGGRGICTTEMHINANCFIHNVFSDSLLGSLYSSVKESGSYMEIVSLSDMRGNDAGISGSKNQGESIIYVTLNTEGDTEYMMIFNTEIYPLESTVSTLRIMLIYISITLIIIAALISAFISDKMSKPVYRMSREVGKLALGDYNVHFNGGYCRETTELSDALNHAAYELSQLDRMQKDLIANISHDLRTPLTMIAGYSEVMRDLPGEMTAENMQIIIDETNRLTSLVNDLLDVSRLSSGKQTLNMSVFSLTESINETIQRYSKLKEREGYSIVFKYESEAVVRADKIRILQVLYNLVNNAINYTGDDKKVEIRQFIVDGTCRIEVIDTGSGISEDELPMIWERYYKAKEFHKRSSIGTGLGLSIVKNILVLHNAQFGVSSKRGEGSTFWFELPIYK